MSNSTKDLLAARIRRKQKQQIVGVSIIALIFGTPLPRLWWGCVACCFPHGFVGGRWSWLGYFAGVNKAHNRYSLHFPLQNPVLFVCLPMGSMEYRPANLQMFNQNTTLASPWILQPARGWNILCFYSKLCLYLLYMHNKALLYIVCDKFMTA